MNIELKPCPFCGTNPEARWSQMNPKARCRTEGCKGSQLPITRLDDPEDIAAWNTRAALAQVQDEVCPTCGETEPYTGSCGTSNNDTKALCKQPTQATQAEMTDAEIEALFGKCGGHWNGDQWVIEDADLHPFARAILTLSPERVPMTDEQVDAFRVDGRLHWLGKRQLVRAVEAHHGITAQAKKGGA